ncbi:MAG: hypothetical protein EBZ87_01925, partial [Microbacteriaceae bacterium]|nr:hypothetical protein [Microbacteriaceae bacterium]
MSEVLLVAKHLSNASDEDLARVIGIRLMPSGNFADFFDLASALLKPQSVSGAIAGLTRGQIAAFTNLLNNQSNAADKPYLEVLATLFLVYKTVEDGKTKYIPFESAKEAFKQQVGKGISEVSLSNSTPVTPFEQIDPQAGLSAFETVQAITELLIDLEQRYVPEVGRGSVGLPEL